MVHVEWSMVHVEWSVSHLKDGVIIDTREVEAEMKSF